MKKKHIWILLAGAAVLGGGYWLAPAQTKDKIIGLASFATDERRCFNYHRSSFVDPESAYVADSYIWTKENELHSMKVVASPGDNIEDMMDQVFKKYDAILRVNAYAKNRMGGYVSETVECPLIDGHFDEHAAFMYKYDKKELNALPVAPAAEALPDDRPMAAPAAEAP